MDSHHTRKNHWYVIIHSSLCVLFVFRYVTTRSNSFEPLPRISVERDERNQRTACESGQASFQTPRGSRATTGG